MNDDPQHDADVHEPERPVAETLVEACVGAGAIARAELNEAERQHAEGAEQRGMRVVQRQEGAVLVVVRRRRIERNAAEHTGAHEVPESEPK